MTTDTRPTITVRLPTFYALDWEQRDAIRSLLATALRIPLGRDVQIGVDLLPME